METDGYIFRPWHDRILRLDHRSFSLIFFQKSIDNITHMRNNIITKQGRENVGNEQD